MLEPESRRALGGPQGVLGSRHLGGPFHALQQQPGKPLLGPCSHCTVMVTLGLPGSGGEGMFSLLQAPQKLAQAWHHIGTK